jgi:hypothetical protein
MRICEIPGLWCLGVLTLRQPKTMSWVEVVVFTKILHVHTHVSVSKQLDQCSLTLVAEGGHYAKQYGQLLTCPNITSSQLCIANISPYTAVLVSVSTRAQCEE